MGMDANKKGPRLDELESQKPKRVLTDGGRGGWAARHGVPVEVVAPEEFDRAVASREQGAVWSAPMTDRERLEAMERLLPPESPFSPGSAAGGSVAEERAIARWHERWGAISDTIDAAKAKLGPEVGRTRGLPTMPSNSKPPA